MCLLTVKACIIHWINIPFLCIKEVYKVIKIYFDNPNSWDRYLKFKEIEHNNKIKQERQETAILYINFIGEVFKFARCPLIYCSYSDASDVTEDEYKTLQDEFNVAKENIKNQITELEKGNTVISSEFKTIVESTNVDSFTDLNECQEFYQKLKSLLDEIINVT